ncbi:MAG TPA: hypothetical protein VMT64_08670, partial [Candidatus Binataceae bacterium]|nr:hypothetical protein [Candidatus Binataceae bacterium]
MKYPSLLLTLAVPMVLLASACGGPSAAGASNTPSDAPQKMVVAVATAREQDMMRTAQAQGALFPKEKAVLASEVMG